MRTAELAVEEEEEHQITLVILLEIRPEKWKIAKFTKMINSPNSKNHELTKIRQILQDLQNSENLPQKSNETCFVNFQTLCSNGDVSSETKLEMIHL